MFMAMITSLVVFMAIFLSVALARLRIQDLHKRGLIYIYPGFIEFHPHLKGKELCDLIRSSWLLGLRVSPWRPTCSI